MKVLFDTNVIVAAFINSHPEHKRSLPWLQKAVKKKIEGLISVHSLIEVYSVITRLPLSPRISTDIALKLIKENILNSFKLITYSSKDYIDLLASLEKNSISGGASYDGLILWAAEKSKADKIITLNASDFIRVSPGLVDKISEP
ncbi:MAG: PIN domain-containing protein [Actinomycetia bacterium]|nr:PIN domain-containing protein [Actinomycetes bacterium]